MAVANVLASAHVVTHSSEMKPQTPSPSEASQSTLTSPHSLLFLYTSVILVVCCHPHCHDDEARRGSHMYGLVCFHDPALTDRLWQLVS